jgi:5-methylcytosine-specific restriction endonuclease McrA
MNRWKIPASLEDEIRKRDKCCVYCRAIFKDHLHARGVPKNKATWEHIDNNEANVSKTNVVLCCGACNSSKGEKRLLKWFESEYCRKRNINARSVSPVIRKWLKAQPQGSPKSGHIGSAENRP